MLQIVSCYAKAHRADMDFAYLTEIMEQAEGQEETPGAGEPFKKYRELFHKNNEMAGWISIDRTKIHYPVMHTPDNPDYYLNHGFEKKSSAYGVPYIAGHCNPFEPDDN